MTIDGPDSSAQRVTVSGNNANRVFNINPGKTVTIRDLTLTQGSTPSPNFGGAIYNDHSTLTLIGVTVSNSTADFGGGIFSNGSLSGSATLTIIDSTISGNTTHFGDGGGIDNFGISGNATLNLTNSTISGNRAKGNGGGIFSNGPLLSTPVTITNCTITDNRANNENDNFGQGGGLGVAGANPVIVRNSLVDLNFNGASPSTTPDDISAALVPPSASTHNLIGNCFNPCFLTDGVNNNHLNVPAASLNIGPISANGGINQTHALLPGSIAIEAGNNAYVVAPPFDNVSPITDERGAGFPRQVGAAVDIGSFEANYAITATAGTGQSTIVGSAFVTNLAATVTESGNPVSGVSVTFTAPGSGASGTFANSTNTETVTTNASGIATASQFTANAIQGNYNVVATATGVPGSASFNLTNIIGPATHFLVSAPASATAGSAFSFTVTAQDQFNNPTTGYAGTVHFTSSDGSAVLPANSTLTNGAGTFSATLKTAGNQTINCDRHGDKFHHRDQRHDCGKRRIGDAFLGQRTGFRDGRCSFQFHRDGAGPIQQHGHELCRDRSLHQHRWRSGTAG